MPQKLWLQWVSLTCKRRPCSHGQCHEPQQAADCLGSAVGSHQLKGNRGHKGNETAITQAQEDTHSHQRLKHHTLRHQHGGQTQEHEGASLRRGHGDRWRNTLLTTTWICAWHLQSLFKMCHRSSGMKWVIKRLGLKTLKMLIQSYSICITIWYWGYLK